MLESNIYLHAKMYDISPMLALDNVRRNSLISVENCNNHLDSKTCTIFYVHFNIQTIQYNIGLRIILHFIQR